MEKACFGYIGVLTATRGQKRNSLQEQKDRILRYAQGHGLSIVQWFEERISAAKPGRPVFKRMMKHLQRREVRGLIIHKIGGSLRNMENRAVLSELIVAGLEVHFTNEGLGLKTRGGKLSDDALAVVAADYVRKLREETRRGLTGD